MLSKEEAAALIPIYQAIADGKPLQVKIWSDSKWEDVTEDHAFRPSEHWYRVKPEVKRYRRILLKHDEITSIGAYNEHHGWGPMSVEQVESDPTFVRWIDNEWQEVEV